MSDKEFVNIKVMGYDFRVACPLSERDLLNAAIQLLQVRVEEIKSAGKAIDVERTVIMAALSISHDYVKVQENEAFDISTIQSRIENMNHLIDNVFHKSNENLV